MCASVQNAWVCVELTWYARCVTQSEGQYVRLRPGRVGMCSTSCMYANVGHSEVQQGQYVRLRPGRVECVQLTWYARCVTQSEGQYVRLRPGRVGMC